MNGISNRLTGYLRRAPGGVSELLVEAAAMPVRKHPNQITYAIADSSAGRLVIATTRRGLCWIGMHDSVEYLESELRKDHPQAEVSRDDAQTRELARMIVAEITNDSSALELPLDIRATPFQLAVWRELCAIPEGATRSYGEIAARIGRPSLARALIALLRDPKARAAQARRGRGLRHHPGQVHHRGRAGCALHRDTRSEDGPDPEVVRHRGRRRSGAVDDLPAGEDQVEDEQRRDHPAFAGATTITPSSPMAPSTTARTGNACRASVASSTSAVVTSLVE